MLNYYVLETSILVFTLNLPRESDRRFEQVSVLHKKLQT